MRGNVTPMMSDAHSLVQRPPDRAALVVLGADSPQLRAAPQWFLHRLGIRAKLPIPLHAGRPDGLGALGDLASDVDRLKCPISDAIVELQGEGDPTQITVLVQARPSAGGTFDRRAAVEMLLDDVTDVVRERRRALGVGSFHGLVGRSFAMIEVYQKIATYGPTEAPILITGETGTGKELVARALHERSARAGGPFVAVNCSALTSELFESELFGHEKGSFTGAYRQHKGRFERADGGTLFLDEIGDMPLMSQAKMLRTLEEGVIERVGGEAERHVDVRVVAATNVALEQAVTIRRFRADLYHRISVLRVHVPPLRERTDDIPLLVDHFLATFNRRYNKTIRRVTPEALRILSEYYWPGNIRELRNVIERLVVEANSDAIGGQALRGWLREREYLMPGAWNADSADTPRRPIYTSGPDEEELGPALSGSPRFGNAFWGTVAGAPPLFSKPAEIGTDPATSPRTTQETNPEETVDLTVETIRTAYRNASGNLTKAARLLGVHKATLYRHMKRLGLTREALEEEAT